MLYPIMMTGIAQIMGYFHLRAVCVFSIVFIMRDVSLKWLLLPSFCTDLRHIVAAHLGKSENHEKAEPCGVRKPSLSDALGFTVADRALVLEARPVCKRVQADHTGSARGTRASHGRPRYECA
jgi:hypothetical protein